MQRASSKSFIHQFEVRAGTSGWKYARQVEDHARRLYNAGLGEILKRIKALKTSNAWQVARKLTNQEKLNAFEKLKKDAQISLRDIEIYLKEVRNKSADFQRCVGSHVTQKLAERIWKAAEKYLFAKAKRLRFKRKGQPFSFEGKNNATFLRFLKEELKEERKGDIKEKDQTPYVMLGQQRFDLVYSKADPYDQHALKSHVKYVRWLRKQIKGQDRFFVQVVLEGLPFVDEQKQHKALGRLKTRLKEAPLQSEAPYQGVVGLDFGPRKVAVSTASQGFECDLAQGLQTHQKHIRTLQRQIDRQRRAANPDRFDEAGRCINGRGAWNRSKSQRRIEQKIADIQRKETATRRSKHGALVNEILHLGQFIKTENISFRALQKRYGKSVGQCAPSAFLGELTRKAEQARGWCERINTFQTCLSQHCICGERRKKPLNQRVHRCESCGFGQDVKVDRDLFSAYLAVFTHNQETSKKFKKKVQFPQWESSLNLEQAREQIMGHRTLSLAAQSAATLKVQSVGVSSAGAHVGVLEDLAKSSSNAVLDPSPEAGSS